MAEILAPDLCVIGTGHGAIAAAIAARSYGAEVVVIATGPGEGVPRIVPAKALIASAQRAHAVRTASHFGVGADEPKVNFGRVHDHLQDVVAGMAPASAPERLAALGIRTIESAAQFLDGRTVEAGDVRVQARRFVIATSSQPILPEIAGLEEVDHFNAETILANTRRPGHLLVVGGGRSAMELAQAYVRLGAAVTVIAGGPALPGADPELAEVVVERLREEGVVVREDARAVALASRPNGVAATVATDGGDETISVTDVLVPGSRIPDFTGLAIERGGVRRSRSDSAFLQLSTGLRTTNWRISAIGEAAGAEDPGLADWQAQQVVRGALFGEPVRNRPTLVPTMVDTDPAIAEIGMTEATARQRFKDGYRIVRAAFAGNARARAIRETHGLVKLVVATDGRILGTGIVGPEAGELAALFALAMARRLKVSDLGDFVAPHPSLSEIAVALAQEFARDAPGSAWHRWLLGVNRRLP